MSIIKLVALALFVILASNAAYSSVDIAEIEAAQAQVKEYRALRRACSITKGEQRKVCFSQLNAATEDYKKAKRVLAMHRPSGEQQMLGQAQ